jgi:hypothetical protein
MGNTSQTLDETLFPTFVSLADEPPVPPMNSIHKEAAVDVDDLAGDVAAIVGRQKQGTAGDIFGPTHFSQWDLLHQVDVGV